MAAALRWHANRLREAFIEQCDALELIQRMDSPDTAIYLDPPYLRSTRNAAGSGRYVKEMDAAAPPPAGAAELLSRRGGPVRVPVAVV